MSISGEILMGQLQYLLEPDTLLKLDERGRGGGCGYNKTSSLIFSDHTFCIAAYFPQCLKQHSKDSNTRFLDSKSCALLTVRQDDGS